MTPTDSGPRGTVVAWRWEDGWTLERAAGHLADCRSYAEFSRAKLMRDHWLQMDYEGTQLFLLARGPDGTPEAVFSVYVNTHGESSFFLASCSTDSAWQSVLHFVSLVSTAVGWVPVTRLDHTFHQVLLRLAPDQEDVLCRVLADPAQSSVLAAFDDLRISGSCADPCAELEVLCGRLPSALLPRGRPPWPTP